VPSVPAGNAGEPTSSPAGGDSGTPSPGGPAPAAGAGATAARAAPSGATFYRSDSASASRATRGTAPRVVRLRAPRPFLIRGSKRAARAILTFRLPARSLVVFQIRRIAPSCAAVGTFRVRGRAGLNRVRFPGRVRGRLLPPGTYELRALGLPNVRVRVAILPRGSSARDARAALRATNVCPSVQPEPEPTPLASTAGAGAPPASEEPPSFADGESTAGGVASSAPSGPSGTAPPREGRLRSFGGDALGTIASGAREAGPLALGLILAGIVAAILLLVTASLPQTAARGQLLATLVTDHRLELTLAGVATLVVVTLAYLISVT
jgi:hypothetical protein